MTEYRLDTFTTFGELLRYLRRQAQLTQQQLGIAVGYSATMITRLENGERAPEMTAVKTSFIEALSLKPESATANLLVALAQKARGSASITHLPTPASNTNLPASLTPIVGREREISEVQRLIENARLVTLTGAGGVGKTRLALEVGSRLLDQYPGGVWLIELAPATDATLVPQIAAAVFGVQERSGQPALQALAARVGDTSLLIILDNCEHLIGVCAGFAEYLLRTCPRLKMVATSREALRVSGEVAWWVPSLRTPEPAARTSAQQLMECASAQFFVQQALMARPDFVLTDANVSAVAQICRRLDGIPLAIEMAAARLPGMTVDEIAVRLDHRFQLLTSGRRTALPRQQTLQAALEWSYRLLSEPERVLLERLSVFADGCLPDAATAVCAAPPIPADEVLPLLLALVDKSLLVAEQRRLGETRYRLLETVRAFAAERLDQFDGAEAERLHQRHAAFMIELANRWWRERLIGAEKTDFIRRLETELSNVRALLGWARGRPDAGALYLELAAALWTLWVSGGFLSEGQAWLEQALAGGKTAPGPARARALSALAQVLTEREDYSRMESASHECLVLAERIHDVDLISSALLRLGLAAQWRLDFTQAIAHLTRGLGLAREADLQRRIPDLLIALGRVYLQCGEISRAGECLEEGVRHSMQLDILPSVAMGRRYQSLVDLHTTLDRCAEDVDRYRADDHPRAVAMSLYVLGHLLIAEGQHEQAELVLVESHALWSQLGLLRAGRNGGTPLALFELARLAWLRGQADLALARYHEFLEVATLAGDNDGQAHAHLWLGYLTLGEGDRVAARRHIQHSLMLWQAAWHKTVALAAAARLAELSGDSTRAARLYGAASARAGLVRASLTATERLVFERDMQSAQARAGDLAWVTAWESGARLTLEQAVIYTVKDESGA